MYECPICLSVNHNHRLHCRVCGTIPAKYSIIGVPAHVVADNSYSRFIPAVVAVGAVHSCKHHAARINLSTVPLDYYAEA